MRIKRALSAAVWVLCFFNALLVAQEERPLSVKIADSIREREPEWLLTREEQAKYYEFCKCSTLDAVWAKGSARLSYVVYTHKSKEDADATYKYLMEFHKFSNAKASDESYLAELQYHYLALDGPGQWYPAAGSKLYMYFLRRGREVLMVAGDTPELVKKFSALIAAEFPAT